MTPKCHWNPYMFQCIRAVVKFLNCAVYFPDNNSEKYPGILYPGHMTVYRYTVISPGYKIPGYFSELSSGKYTAQFKNFTTARMHRHMYGFQWHFGVIFPSQDTIWSIILFTTYYFTAINIFLSLHYTEILNSIIIPSIPYRTRHARSLSLRATQFWEKTNSQQTLTYDNFLFLTDLLIQHSPDL